MIGSPHGNDTGNDSIRARDSSHSSDCSARQGRRSLNFALIRHCKTVSKSWQQNRPKVNSLTRNGPNTKATFERISSLLFCSDKHGSFLVPRRRRWTHRPGSLSGSALAIATNTASCIRTIHRLQLYISNTSFPRSTVVPMTWKPRACVHRLQSSQGLQSNGYRSRNKRGDRAVPPAASSVEEHFVWDGIYIIGKTAIGRTTVRVLDMNTDDQLGLRSS